MHTYKLKARNYLTEIQETVRAKDLAHAIEIFTAMTATRDIVSVVRMPTTYKLTEKEVKAALYAYSIAILKTSRQAKEIQTDSVYTERAKSSMLDKAIQDLVYLQMNKARLQDILG